MRRNILLGIALVMLVACHGEVSTLPPDANADGNADGNADANGDVDGDADGDAHAQDESPPLEPIPDMVPMPKRYEQRPGIFKLDGKTIFIDQSNRQCEIAADEIALRIERLGGHPGQIESVGNSDVPGIYVLPVTHAIAAELKSRLALEITADDPGPQGYVIATTSSQLAIIGSDDIGTLYGAMTLRQMMTPSGEDDGVHVAAARVHDKPDYHFRGTVSFERGLNQLGVRLEDYQAGIDTMMHYKINLLWDYNYWLDPRQVGTQQRNFYATMNAYARERGVYSSRGEDHTCLGGSYDLDLGDPRFSDWPCVRSTDPKFYCWSRDEMARERANRLMDLYADCGFSIFFLHPVDGGGDDDPELWSWRCDQCDQRFGDDRAMASAHQYGLWLDVMREKGLDLIFISPIYPYSAGGFYYDDCDTDECLLRRKNVPDYFRALHPQLDSSVIPVIWMGQPDMVARYREVFAGRPLAIYAHSMGVLGYFGTWHRRNGTNYVGDPRDIFLNAGGNLYPLPGGGLPAMWMNRLASVEYTWNTNAPGSEPLDGWHLYEVEKDHMGPREILEEWLPRASRLFYGREVGDRLAPIFQEPVLPYYLEKPAAALNAANYWTADSFEDTAEQMERQVQATQEALDALNDAHPHIHTLDKVRRQSFIYFYRRMPLWNLLTKARYATRRAAELVAAGNTEAAQNLIDEAKQQLAEDRTRAAHVLDETASEPDLLDITELLEIVDTIEATLTLP